MSLDFRGACLMCGASVAQCKCIHRKNYMAALDEVRKYDNKAEQRKHIILDNERAATNEHPSFNATDYDLYWCDFCKKHTAIPNIISRIVCYYCSKPLSTPL